MRCARLGAPATGFADGRKQALSGVRAFARSLRNSEIDVLTVCRRFLRNNVRLKGEAHEFAGLALLDPRRNAKRAAFDLARARIVWRFVALLVSVFKNRACEVFRECRHVVLRCW